MSGDERNRGGWQNDPRAPSPDPRTGPADRRATRRPRGASAPRRFEDHLRVEPHLRCKQCGGLWLTEIVRERFEQGEGCLRCGGDLEEVEGAPQEQDSTS